MLKGRAAIVTGSTSGIGKGIAKALAENGCDLMLNGFGDMEEVEHQRSTLARMYGVEVLYSDGDMSQECECEELVSEAEARLGRLDILVNNAGIQYIAAVEDFPTDRWNSILAINLTAAFHTIKRSLPIMKRSGWGRIINIASTHGLVASPGKSAYVAAKHGLVGLTKVVALEAAGAGITSNAICPGWVSTPLIQQQIEGKMEREGVDLLEATHRLVREKQPSGLFTTIEQIASLVLYLCNDDAGNITGASIPIDGGWLAQ